MKTNIEQIENHLKAGNWIAIVNGSKKLSKGSTTNRYNYSIEDILKEAPSVEAFMKSLPSKGFGNGSLLQFREKKAGAIRTTSEIELTFADQPQPNFALAGPVEHQTPQNQPMQQNYQHNTPPQPVAPAAMGYAQMPIHEVVSLTVMKERYAEMVEQKARTEKQRDEAESNLRIAKEKEAALQIRLDSIEDRHSFAMERAEASQKKWLDKLEPNQVLEALPALSGLITAMKGNGAAPQVGMGNPMPQLSEDKTNFLQTLKQVPDDLIPLLESFVYHIMTNENYRNEVTMYLNSMDQQIPQG